MGKKRFLIGLGIVGVILTVFFILVVGGAVIINSYYSSGFGRDKVGIIEVTGLIQDSREINKEIIAFRDREDIKAIVLRIDSPGGGVGPSQEIYEEIKKTRDKKKIVASMGSVAASGGYYIASAADKIVANPGTITGSIGVIMQFTNVEGFLSKIGVKGYVVKSGEFKDTGSPLRDISTDEKELLQGLIDNVYGQFVDVIAENRGMEIEDVRKVADGRILSGAQAQDARLVDELGNLQYAIDLASNLAGIEGKPSVIYPKRKRITFLDIIFGEGILRLLEKTQGLYYSPQLLLYLN
ncbi:MAG: signal peptide peptidase SppA [Thermodesulfobacteriota bacterium]